jgi:hypothetical protein
MSWDTWGEDNHPTPKSEFDRHRSKVRRFAANTKRDRLHRARPARHNVRPAATRPRAAAREYRPAESRRASSSSTSSGADPGDPDESEPPSTARQCAGCGCDISHKRPHAKTCGADRCKKRVQRSARRSSWVDLASEIRHVEDRIEGLLLERQGEWRKAARDGGRRFLTTQLADELQKAFATRAELLARYAQDALVAQPCPGHDERRTLELVSDGHCLKCGRGTVASFGCRTTAEYSLPPVRRTASSPGRWPIVRAA